MTKQRIFAIITVLFVCISFQAFAVPEKAFVLPVPALAVTLVAGLLAFLVFRRFYRRMGGMVKAGQFAEGTLDRLAEIRDEFKTASRLVAYGLPLLIAGIVLYVYAESAGWSGHLQEWMNLLIRWTHVILGIAWIGASFYFIFLENSLNRTEGLREGLAGNLWAIHGGGFYYVEKYKTAPETLPKNLHWFKYEAYFTWLSGIMLLIVVYYMNAKSFMVDPAVKDLSSGAAISIGIGSLVAGWFFYDFLCSTSLINKKMWFGVVMFAFISLMSWLLSQYLSGRAAYIHIGAMIGTMMAGNVFRVIIPSQKALVKAAKEGKPVDPSLGQFAGLRSLHNNYFTLPVIFIMISNHFPATFGNAYQWAVLAGLTLASALVRHYINQHEKGISERWIIPVATLMIMAMVFVTRPQTSSSSSKNTEPVAFSQVQPIIQKRCMQCHAENPTDDVNVTAPNGIKFDNPKDIVRMAERIKVRAVTTKTMPQGNKTGITDEERELIGRWIDQGAKL
jgi:uncharacterized membrane protein